MANNELVKALKEVLVKACAPYETKKQAVEKAVTQTDRKTLVEFFGEQPIERVCQRYGMDPKSTPQNVGELGVLLLGLATNLNSKDIEHIQKHFDNKNDMAKFLKDNLWSYEVYYLSLANRPQSKPTLNTVNRLIAKTNKVDKKRIQTVINQDFLARGFSRFNAITLNDWASVTLQEKVDPNSLALSKTSGLSGREQEASVNDSVWSELKASLHSEYLSKSLGYYGIYPTELAPQGQVLPIVNETGMMEFYQLETTYNKNGLVYQVFSILSPKLHEESHDILTIFTGSTGGIASLRRDTDTVGYVSKESTPGRNLLNSHSIEIISKIGEVAQKLKARTQTDRPLKLKIAGHSLGGSDAQNLLVQGIHVQALDKLKKNPKHKFQQELAQRKSVQTCLKQTQKRIKTFMEKTKTDPHPQLEEFGKLKIDLGVWGSAGIYSKENKSACILMDKLGMSKDINMQFSHVQGDPIKSTSTRLGSLGGSKKKAGTKQDFRPQGKVFQRSKVVWSNTGFKRSGTHVEHTYLAVGKLKGDIDKSKKIIAKIRQYHNTTKAKPKAVLDISDLEVSDISIEMPAPLTPKYHAEKIHVQPKEKGDVRLNEDKEHKPKLDHP